MKELRPCQISVIERFAKIIDDWKLPKKQQGSKFTFGTSNKTVTFAQKFFLMKATDY